MIIPIKVEMNATIELNAGDRVELLNSEIYGERATVKRVVESRKMTYAVLTNNTYRPITSYGRTWRKL